jgi:cold shock CspA family protein
VIVIDAKFDEFLAALDQKIPIAARALLIASSKNREALDHLRRSFTHGDNHYEAQFWFARELFLLGYFEEAEKVFLDLNDRAPGRFRTRASAAVERDGVLVAYDCRVGRKEEGYAFVKLPQFPKDIFASRAESNFADWDKLYTGANVKCVLAFSRRGPRAVSVCLA